MPKLSQKCLNTGFFLVRIFLYSVQIQENTGKTFVFTYFSHSSIIITTYLETSAQLLSKTQSENKN